MHIDQLNIRNLTSLWNKYGAELVVNQSNNKLIATQSWPYRCWVDGEQNLTLQLSRTPKTHRLSSWPHPLGATESIIPSMDKRWQLEFEQTAMYLPLNELAFPIEQHQNDISLCRIEDFESLVKWLEISSEAFGYEIDKEVFKPLLDDHEIEIYLGYVNQQPAVSALLYKTDKVIGLHQMGVKRNFQGQGLAQKSMNLLLARAQQQGAEYMVLQASEAGLPLYLNFGFQKQFKLSHFQFVEDNSDTL